MTGSAALDILIGLFTLYFVMSTLCSSIFELVSNIVALRSKMLKSFLEFQFYKLEHQKETELGKGISNFAKELDKKYWHKDANETNTNQYALNLEKFYQIQGANTPSPAQVIPFGKSLIQSINSENFAQTLNMLVRLTGDRGDIPKLYLVELNKLSQIKTDLNKQNTTDKDVKAILDKLSQTEATLTDLSTRMQTAQTEYTSAVTKVEETKTDQGKNDANENRQQKENILNNLCDYLKCQLKVMVDDLQPTIQSLKKQNTFPKIVTTFEEIAANLDAISRIGTNGVDATVADLKKLVSDLPPSQIKDVLINAIQQSSASINEVTKQVANWFDGEMERLTDIYRRRSRLFLFIIGLLVAAILNVNTIDIADALAKNPALREAVVEQAKTLTTGTNNTTTEAEGKETWTDALNQLNALALPIGQNICSQSSAAVDNNQSVPKATGTVIPTATSTPTATPAPETATIVNGKVTNNVKLQITPLSCKDPNVGVFGILITAAAVALGAPFWFDLLKSLTSRSSSGSSEGDAKKSQT